MLKEDTKKLIRLIYSVINDRKKKNIMERIYRKYKI